MTIRRERFARELKTREPKDQSFFDHKTVRESRMSERYAKDVGDQRAKGPEVFLTISPQGGHKSRTLRNGGGNLSSYVLCIILILNL